MNKNKLKIGLVFDDTLDSNDGVQQYVKSLGGWLIEQGHEVRFLVGETKNAGPFQPFVHSLSRNITIRGNQNKMFLPFFSRKSAIKKVLDEESFDVLHVMMPTNPFMGSRVIKCAGSTPVVGTFHMVGGTWFVNLGARILRIIQRRTLRRIDLLLSVSHAAQSFEKKYFRLKSEVSPNMVQMDKFTAGESREFMRGEKATITFLGRLVERKGAIHLLQAVRLLHQDRKLEGVRINICGDGELRSELEQFVQDHQLHDNVIFHGFISEEDKPDFLASSDLTVYPATGGEAFGIVLIEAMSTGASVVLGGDNSGYRSVLGGREELLFDPYNAKALADRIESFLNSPAKAKSAIKWQLAEVKQYDVNEVGIDMVKRYRKLIKQLETTRV